MKTHYQVLGLGLILIFGIAHRQAYPETTPRQQDLAAWEERDQTKMETKFRTVLTADPKYTPAWIGLACLYELQQKPAAAWEAFSNVLAIEPDPYPYIFSAMTTPKFRENFKKKVSPLLLQLSKQADTSNILRAMTHEKIGEYYYSIGKLKAAKKHFQKQNSINDWLIIGPFENIAASGHLKVYPPEVKFVADTLYKGKNGIPLRWLSINASQVNQWLNFLNYFPYSNAVFYANNFIYSPQKQVVEIRIGTSGSFKFFLNDELALECAEERDNDLDTYIVAIELQAGWNRCLMKCGYSDISRCNFMLRITDNHGNPVPGLIASVETRPYVTKPGAILKVQSNFAEEYFKQKIVRQPTQPAYYLLLADCYLRNDKAELAEELLRQALQIFPGATFLYYRLLEAYRRQDKTDEVKTTLEKIYHLDKNVPDVLEYKTQIALKNKNFEQAEHYLKEFENLNPSSETSYELYILFHQLKNEPEKVEDWISKAWLKYPDNYHFMFLVINLFYQKTHNVDQIIKILNRYLDRNFNRDAYEQLALFYLMKGDVKAWQKTWQRYLEFEPADTEVYEEMAEVYRQLKDYQQAQELLEIAVHIRASSASHWAALGEIYQLRCENFLAKAAFGSAINLAPTRYSVREKLRRLYYLPPIFNNFETVNIPELISHSPAAQEYPGDGAIILLDDAKRVVYENGGSEFMREMLIKVFDQSGIDNFKHFQIPFNFFHQELTVEKAVVIKSDGTQIEGDQLSGTIVFKSLEKNDFLHIKWKLQNNFIGNLAQYFWDEFHFNDFYPRKMVRYSLFTSQDKILVNAQNMNRTPIKKQIPEGFIYQWTLKDEPALKYETAMPTIEDVTKILYLSDMRDWEELVNWYYEVTRSRLRSSFEIKAQVRQLFEGQTNLSTEDKIRLIYNFVNETIRYSYVPFRQSGLIPQKARDVLVNRMGDCKDMVTLAIAMLKEVGIEACYVLINTQNAGLNRETLPSIAFNHCILAAETDQGLIYLDPTATGFPAGYLPQQTKNSFSLLIKKGIKQPEYLSSVMTKKDVILRTSKVTLSADQCLNLHCASIETGSPGAELRTILKYESQPEKQKIFDKLLSQKFGYFQRHDLQIDNSEILSPAFNHSFSITIPGALTINPDLLIFKIPWFDKLEGYPVFAYSKRTQPFQIEFAADTLRQNMEVLMPEGYGLKNDIQATKLTNKYADYSLGMHQSGNRLQFKRLLTFKNDRIPPADFPSFQAFWSQVIQTDDQLILLQKVAIKTQLGKLQGR